MESIENLTPELNCVSTSIKNNSKYFNYSGLCHNENSNNEENFYNNLDNNSTDSGSFDKDNIEADSKTHGYGSVSDFQNEQEFLKTEISGIIFCKKCYIPCLINFMENLELQFECGCTYIENFDISEFINDYLKQKTDQSKDFKIHCPYHKGETEFLKYCTDCGYDLCKECLNKNSELYSNTSKVNKAHENHTLIDLNKKMDSIDLDEFKSSIDKCEKTFFFTKEGFSDKLNNIFNVMISLIEHYRKYKNYNSYESIKNAEIFMEKIINPDKYNFRPNLKKGKYIRLMKQTSEKDFEENIINHFNLIREISIKNINKEINFSKIKNINFQNLKVLIIRGRNFKEIYPLFSCRFPVLEHLDLEKNCIDNTIIELLEKLNLTELKILNLFKNNITDEKIFNLIKQYKKLNTFFIGENPIEFDAKLEIYYSFPESLEEFGMTGNLDPIKVYYIKKLEINNLKIFYISRNKIDNLKCLENIKFKRLEEFWAISNLIKDIKQLMYINGKENLKKINLKENQINNFDELIDIIQYFPKLKELILINNNIPESKAIEMEKKIKEIYNHELKIEVIKKE